MPVDIRRLRVALLAVVAFVAVACSSATTVEQTSAVELPDPPNATAATLKLADFPAGWTAEEPAASEQTKCAVSPESVTVQSKDFSGDRALVSNEIEVYDTVADANKDFALVRDVKFVECLRNELVASLTEAFGPSVRFTESTGTPLPIELRGQDSAALRFIFRGFDGDAPASVHYDVVLVRVGRMIAFYHFIGFGHPFDDALRNQLIDASAKRMPVTT